MARANPREAARLRCYHEGMSDREIAKALQEKRTTIRTWRESRHLQIHRDPVRNFTFRPYDERPRLAAYNAGLSDGAIARTLHTTKGVIQAWRTQRGLPPHNTHWATDNRKELYDAGLSDLQVSRRVGCSEKSIQGWRKRHHLPANKHFFSFSPEMRARRILFYQLGWSDRQIAREEHITAKYVAQWRKRLGLAANVRPTKKNRTPPTMKDLLQHIRRAVGYRLPRDIAEDAVADLAVALLDGSIAVERIEADAKNFGNGVIRKFADKYRSRSIDEPIAGTEDLRMIDTLVDESSSSWLEEMGATVY